MTTVRARLGALGEAACAYASAGWRVHPVRAGGKVPLLAGWPERATCDVDQVEAWWRERPRANVGVATGGGLLVLDVDLHGEEDDDGGFATLAALAARGFHLPLGPIAETASGGAHHWFRVDGEVRNAAAFLPGLDLRGDGGYVVVPPSTTDVGGYRWIGEPSDPPQGLDALPPAPDWLLRGLQEPSPARPSFPSREGWGQGHAAEKWLPEVARAAQGTRNDVLFRAASAIAGEAVRRRTDPRTELDALRVAARGAGLGEVEIERTIHSACRVAGLV